MKISEVIGELAEFITENGNYEIGEDFLITFRYGHVDIAY